MKSYNSFNEMAEGTGALEVGGDGAGDLLAFVDNMSPKFTSIPPFHGQQFFVWAHEKGNGRGLVPPHVHIKLQDGEIKCWIARGANRNQVEVARSSLPESKSFLIDDVVKHLQKNWVRAGREWNDFIDENYPEFSNDPKNKVPVEESAND